jgi:SAM-dependent methyltransferase
VTGEPTPAGDRFAPVAANYDRWVGWEPRLRKEMPFLAASIPAGAAVLDAGCGTGAHARALAAAGYRVTGADASAAMLEQARAIAPPDGPPIEWTEADLTDPASLGGRRFEAVLALGNALPAFGEADAVRRGLDALVALTAPGGLLVLQLLNSTRIRAGGRLVAKGTGGETGDVWLRHHFEAGGKLWFHSYQLRHADGDWSVEAQAREYNDFSPAELAAILERSFDRVELFDGLTGNPFDPAGSDSLGVRASGRKG